MCGMWDAARVCQRMRWHKNLGAAAAGSSGPVTLPPQNTPRAGMPASTGGSGAGTEAMGARREGGCGRWGVAGWWRGAGAHWLMRPRGCWQQQQQQAHHQERQPQAQQRRRQQQQQQHQQLQVQRPAGRRHTRARCPACAAAGDSCPAQSAPPVRTRWWSGAGRGTRAGGRARPTNVGERRGHEKWGHGKWGMENGGTGGGARACTRCWPGAGPAQALLHPNTTTIIIITQAPRARRLHAPPPGTPPSTHAQAPPPSWPAPTACWTGPAHVAAKQRSVAQQCSG